jgi:sarcosine oxidase subunit gamma
MDNSQKGGGGIERFAQMNQRSPEKGLSRSPLAALDKITISGENPVILEEHSLGQLVLRGQPAVLEAALASLRDLTLPVKALTSCEQDYDCIRWLSPDEWLLTLPVEEVFDVEKALRDQASGRCAIVNVSGGQTVLSMQGVHAIDVLKKSTSYDTDLRNFEVGKVVTTTFAQAQVCLRRVNVAHFELIIRRSFANYLFAWIQDASAEYGFVFNRSDSQA